jgi:hypothetical protein
MGAAFDRYIGIDYSGAETCESGLRGLRVYMGDRATEPREVAPPPSPRKNWTRKAIAHWLVRDSHQQDAYATAEWLRRSDQAGSLERFFSPSLTEHERKVAEIEGWILGIA